MAITYRGVRFSGYNKPKRTPKHRTKSHAVLAKSGSRIKLIRFGQQGVRGAGKKPKTAAARARRRSFKARHRKNIARGKMCIESLLHYIMYIRSYIRCVLDLC